MCDNELHDELSPEMAEMIRSFSYHNEVSNAVFLAEIFGKDVVSTSEKPVCASFCICLLKNGR